MAGEAPVVDSIEISIDVESNKAAQKISSLASSLESLKQASRGIGNTVKAINRINEAFGNTNPGAKVKNLSTGIGQLNAVLKEFNGGAQGVVSVINEIKTAADGAASPINKLTKSLGTMNQESGQKTSALDRVRAAQERRKNGQQSLVDQIGIQFFGGKKKAQKMDQLSLFDDNDVKKTTELSDKMKEMFDVMNSHKYDGGELIRAELFDMVVKKLNEVEEAANKAVKPINEISTAISTISQNSNGLSDVSGAFKMVADSAEYAKDQAKKMYDNISTGGLPAIRQTEELRNKQEEIRDIMRIIEDIGNEQEQGENGGSNRRNNMNERTLELLRELQRILDMTERQFITSENTLNELVDRYNSLATSMGDAFDTDLAENFRNRIGAVREGLSGVDERIQDIRAAMIQVAASGDDANVDINNLVAGLGRELGHLRDVTAIARESGKAVNFEVSGTEGIDKLKNKLTDIEATIKATENTIREYEDRLRVLSSPSNIGDVGTENIENLKESIDDAKAALDVLINERNRLNQILDTRDGNGLAMTEKYASRLSKPMDDATKSAKGFARVLKTVFDQFKGISGASQMLRASEFTTVAKNVNRLGHEMNGVKDKVRTLNKDMSNLTEANGFDAQSKSFEKAQVELQKYEDHTRSLFDLIEKSQNLYDQISPYRWNKNVSDEEANAVRDIYNEITKLSVAYDKLSRSTGDYWRSAKDAIEAAQKDAKKNAKMGVGADSTLGIDKEGLRQIRDRFIDLRSEMKRLGKDYSTLDRHVRSVQNIKGIPADADEIRNAVDAVQDFSHAIDDAKKRELDLSDAIREARKANGNIGIEDVKKLAEAYAEAAQKAREMQQNASSAVSTAKQFGEGYKSKPGEQFDLGKSLSGLKNVFTSKNPLGDAAKQLLDPLANTLKDKIPEAAATAGISLGQLAAGITGVTVAVGALVGIYRLGETAVNNFKDVASKAANVFQKYFAPALKNAAAHASNFAKSIAKIGAGAIFKGLTSIGASVKENIIGPFEKASKTIKHWKNSIGRIAFYRAIRSAVKAVTDGLKTGIDNLYQYSLLVSTKFAPAMNSLATSALYVKNGFAAMTAPLIQMLAPAIDLVVDKLVALFNIFGKVMAALTGQTVYTQAKKHAVDYADAASKASKATKDFMIGIDELNVIDPTAGSAAKDLEDYADMFEEVDVPTDLQDWSGEIKAAIEAGDWKGLGEIIAKKLNELVDSFDGVAWGKKLGEAINKGLDVAYGFLSTFSFANVGSAIADLLTGLNDTLDFDEAGRVIARGMGAMHDFIYGFASALPWASIGQNIATGINGWIDEYDWAMSAESANKLITGIFTALSEAIQGVHWGALADGIAEKLNNIDWYGMITGALQVITNALTALRTFLNELNVRLNWGDIATQIYTAINDGIINAPFNWEALGESIGDFFINAFTFVRDVVSGIGWFQLGQDVADMIGGIDWVALLGTLGEAMAAGINAAIDFVAGLMSNAETWQNVSEGISTGISAFITGIKWDVAITDLSGAIVLFVNTAIDTVKKIVEDEMFWENLKTGVHDGIRNFIENIEWQDAIDALVTGVKGAIDLAITALEALTEDPNFWTDLGTSIGQGINELFSDSDKIVQLITDFGTLVTQILSGIAAAVKEVDWVAVSDALREAFDNLDWVTIGESIMTILGAKALLALKKIDVFLDVGGRIIEGIFEGICNAILGFPEWAKEHILDPILGGIKSVFGIASPSQVMHDEVGVYLIEGLLGGISETWHTITDFFGEALGPFIQTFTDTWDNIKENAGTAWSGIKETIGGWWDQITGKTDESTTQIENTVDTSWNAVDTNSDGLWNTITSTISGWWDKITGNTDTSCTKFKGTVSTTWTAVNTDTGSKWATIKNTLASAWENIKNTAISKFNDLKNSISNIWSSIVSVASSWGSDLCSTIASGISSGISTIKNAASRVASSISSFLHFSEPDVGPLSDFHTYMPDMMSLMAKGIRENSGLAIKEVREMAGEMATAFKTVSVGVEPGDMSGVPDHMFHSSIRYGSVGIDDSITSNSDYSSDQRQNSDSIISALWTLGDRIVSAVEENGGTQITLDGKDLMRSVERAQRQRGANIMAGGVMA